MSLKKRKERLENIQHKKIIIRGESEFETDRINNVYEINLKTGLILLATLQQQADRGDKQVFKIVEKPLHIYLPALSKEHAKILYKRVINQAKK